MPERTQNNDSARTRIIWFNIAGLGAEPLYDLLADGRAPNLGRIFAQALRVERAVSVFPTSTVPCQAALATGCFPERHGLPGNTWMDRFGKQPKYRDYAQAQSALSLTGLGLFQASTAMLPPRAGPAPANSDLSGKARTLYEDIELRKTRSAVLYNPIGRGAHDWLRPARMDIAQFSLCRKNRLEFSHFENTVVKHMVQYIDGHAHLPRLIHFFLPGLDGYTHLHGARSQSGYVRTVLDPLIGQLLEAVGRKRPLEQYTFLLTSDHGHADVRSDRRHCVTNEDVAAVLREQGRRPFFFQSIENLKHVDIVLLNQGGSMHIMVQNGETFRWYDPPRLREDNIDLAVACHDASQKSLGPLAPDWLDIALIKDLERACYLVLRGRKLYEPDKYFAAPANRLRWPNAERRLLGAFSQRSADIILLPNYDQGFYFSADQQPHSGQHGNLSHHDALVPLLLAGPRVNPGTIHAASIVDVAPTLAAAFGTPFPTAQGKALMSFK